MSGWHILVWAGLIHCALQFFNLIFVTCAHFPYIYFLKNTGLEIGIFRIKWCTTVFNRKLGKWGITYSQFWSIWFDIGFVSYIILFPVSVTIILKMSINLLITSSSVNASDNSYIFEPMIPGINLPLDQIGYYIITLLLCTIIHEMGHAMAAVKEGVKLFDIGLSVLFVIPVAFVSMCNKSISSLPVRKQLRIICAGIWHNTVLACIAFVMLHLIPWLLLPLYTKASGVLVKNITPSSPLLGPSGLKLLDIINKVNDCPISNSSEWHDCILYVIQQPSHGYCVRENLIQDCDPIKSKTKNTVNKAVNCCNTENQASSHLCFGFIKQNLREYYCCLQARIVVENKIAYCRSNEDCYKGEQNLICMKPSLSDNTERIVQIKRKEGKDVLFFGQPAVIYRTVSISNWIPKYTFLNAKWPESLILLCEYIVVFSSGFAILNALPCYFLDGQHITTIIIDYLLQFKIHVKRLRQFTTACITTIFTVLLVINTLNAITNFPSLYK